MLNPSCRTAFAATLAAVMAGLLAVPMSTIALAQDPCAAFSWDVSHEREIFASSPSAVTAGRSAASGPTLQADTLYALALSPQSAVTFALPPGSRKVATGAVHAGFARFSVTTPGIYRISADQPVYVDVIAAGQAIASRDFQGRAGCSAPHKVVAFDFPANSTLTLQASGAPSASVRIAVTHAPPAPR